MTPDAPRISASFKVLRPNGSKLYGRMLRYPQHPDVDVVAIFSPKVCVCGKSPRTTAVLPDTDSLAVIGLGRISLAVTTLDYLGPCPCGTPEWIR